MPTYFTGISFIIHSCLFDTSVLHHNTNQKSLSPVSHFIATTDAALVTAISLICRCFLLSNYRKIHQGYSRQASALRWRKCSERRSPYSSFLLRFIRPFGRKWWTHFPFLLDIWPHTAFMWLAGMPWCRPNRLCRWIKENDTKGDTLKWVEDGPNLHITCCSSTGDWSEQRRFKLEVST